MTSCTISEAAIVLPTDAEMAVASDALKALAHPVRLKMFALIAADAGDSCICQIQDQFELSQPTLSHHATVLRKAGLIESRQEGVWMHHRPVPSAVESLVGLLSRLVPQVEAEVIE